MTWSPTFSRATRQLRVFTAFDRVARVHCVVAIAVIGHWVALVLVYSMLQ